MSEEIKKIEKRMKTIKRELQTIGPMIPGSLSQQYNVCGMANCRCKDPENPKKHGPYYQLSYVRKRKSTTRFIKPNMVSDVKKRIENYRKYKKLMDEWLQLSIDHFQKTLEMNRQSASKK